MEDGKAELKVKSFVPRPSSALHGLLLQVKAGTLEETVKVCREEWGGVGGEGQGRGREGERMGTSQEEGDKRQTRKD